jgi:protein Mpv17
MLADQAVFAPIMIVGFFSVTSALEGKSADQIVTKLKRDWPPAIKANYLVWPAAQLVNFTFVPQV